MRAVGYIRVSRVGGREADRFISPALQHEQIEAVARREGLEVVEVVEELDASGGDASRPGWNRAIEMVERGDVGAIVVWNLSRFSRSAEGRDPRPGPNRGPQGGRLFSASETVEDDPYGRLRHAFRPRGRVSSSATERGRASVRPKRPRPSSGGSTSPGRSRSATCAAPTGGSFPTPRRRRSCSVLFERRAKGWSWARLARWADRATGAADALRRGATGARGQQRRRDDPQPRRTRARPATATRTRDDAHEGRPRGRGGGSARGEGEAVGAHGPAHGAVPAPGRSHLLVVQPRHVPERQRAAEPEPVLHVQAAEMLGTHVRPGAGPRLLRPEHNRGAADRTGIQRNARSRPRRRGGVAGRNVRAAAGTRRRGRRGRGGTGGRTGRPGRLPRRYDARRVLGVERYAAAVSDYVAAVNKTEADLAEAREASSGSFELVGRLAHRVGLGRAQGVARAEVRSVVVSKGRER